MGTSSRQCNWSANGQYSRSFNGSSWREFGNPYRMYVAIAKYSSSEAAAVALSFPGMCSIRNLFINDLSLKVKKWCFFFIFKDLIWKYFHTWLVVPSDQQYGYYKKAPSMIVTRIPVLELPFLQDGNETLLPLKIGMSPGLISSGSQNSLGQMLLGISSES